LERLQSERFATFQGLSELVQAPDGLEGPEHPKLLFEVLLGLLKLAGLIFKFSGVYFEG
jgi:hypothetical protein